MPDNHETITISLSDLKALERLAVTEAQVPILAADFQRHRDVSESALKDINDSIGKIYVIIRGMPKQVNDCRDELEQDIKNSYMSKGAGELLEQRLDNSVKSVKIWIVSTVGGFTAAGLFLAWFFKLAGFHLD